MAAPEIVFLVALWVFGGYATFQTQAGGRVGTYVDHIEFLCIAWLWPLAPVAWALSRWRWKRLVAKRREQRRPSLEDLGLAPVPPARGRIGERKRYDE